MLKLYYCRLPDSTPAVQTERLSAYRREKIEKQTNERVRLRSLTAELLLRHALRDGGFAVEGPLNIVVSEQGKPFLRDGGCFFSLSHSADAVLCALADRNVGADIQLASKVNEALIGRFSPKKNAPLSAARKIPTGLLRRYGQRRKASAKWTDAALRSRSAPFPFSIRVSLLSCGIRRRESITWRFVPIRSKRNSPSLSRSKRACFSRKGKHARILSDQSDFPQAALQDIQMLLAHVGKRQAHQAAVKPAEAHGRFDGDGIGFNEKR